MVLERETVEEIRNVKERVEKILQSSERARNDDNWLIFKYLEGAGEDIRIERDPAGGFVIVHRVPYEDFGRQPSRESITRARRYWQMERGLYLPTDMDVLDRRISRSRTFRRVFGDGL